MGLVTHTALWTKRIRHLQVLTEEMKLYCEELQKTVTASSMSIGVALKAAESSFVAAQNVEL